MKTWIDGDSGIIVVPQGCYGADASGFDIGEGTVETIQNFSFWSIVAICYSNLLKRLEDEGFQGKVMLGGELGELVFKVWGKVDS